MIDVKEIYKIGGAHSIAAFAYGTKTIKKVDKIVGPGNSYVAAAKKEVSGDIGIEAMTAGPSEVLIVADKNSDPEWIASDLLGQAEHDSLAQCILISKNKTQETGFWQCTEGSWNCHVTNTEFCHFLEGEGTYVSKKGQVIEVIPGTVAVFPKA